ncbi:MAG: TonB family protein [Verrucomicrobiota bacterium]|jgi:TonB family protein
MNRLQKKCAMVTVGIHLLLVVILIVGPGFFAPKPKADDLQILDVIPANLIDAAVNSGVRNAQPPPPAPVVTPPVPTPPAPTPVVTPPAPPKVVTPEPIKEIVKALTPEPKPVEKPKIQISTQLVTRTAPKNPTANPADDSRRQQQLRQQAFQNAIRSLRNNLASTMTIDMPGNSSVAYANYASVVKSVYEQAWVPPDNAQNDDANVKVTVTIARDGTVISARVLAPSGDTGVDVSVQRTLDRVTFIAPFPEGTTEKERTYFINFNLKAKRALG